MKKAIIVIVAIVAQFVAISGKTPVINVKNHEVVFFTNSDRCYHKSYNCAKRSHQLALIAKENNDTTVYMQTRNGAKKDHIECVLCYGLEK